MPIFRHYFIHFEKMEMTLKRSQTGKIEGVFFFFSEILTHTAVGFLHKKNVGFWLEFALFGS